MGWNNEECPSPTDIQALKDLLYNHKEIELWKFVIGMGELADGYIGDAPRYYLSEIKQWTHDNVRRWRKNKSDQDEEKPNAQRKPIAHVLVMNKSTEIPPYCLIIPSENTASRVTLELYR